MILPNFLQRQGRKRNNLGKNGNLFPLRFILGIRELMVKEFLRRKYLSMGMSGWTVG